MAVKFEKVTDGSVLLDIHSYQIGNMKMRELGCWSVRIIKKDDLGAGVSWNGNRPEYWYKRDIEKLYVNPPKAYRDQCERQGRKAEVGSLA
jgi:hypothetical protein